LRTLTINRIYRPEGTFGFLQLPEQLIHTVERPWADNEPYISCIPEGQYLCKPDRYHRGGYDAIEITAVPDRTDILFHKANHPIELAGCIAPNLSLKFDSKGGHGGSSAIAFSSLMGAYGQESFWLVIKQLILGNTYG